MSELQKLGMSPYGPATFAKAPLVSLDGDWEADVAVMGVPFDLGVGFRPRTRWGPKAIRDMSVRFGGVGAGARQARGEPVNTRSAPGKGLTA